MSLVSGNLTDQAAPVLPGFPPGKVDMADSAEPVSSNKIKWVVYLSLVAYCAFLGATAASHSSDYTFPEPSKMIVFSVSVMIVSTFIFAALYQWEGGSWKLGVLHGLYFSFWIILLQDVLPGAVAWATGGWSGGWESTVVGAGIGAVMGLLLLITARLAFRQIQKSTELVKSDG
jgi:hypothetical protein